VEEELSPDNGPSPFALAGEDIMNESQIIDIDHTAAETAKSLLQHPILGDLIQHTPDDDADDEVAQIYSEDSESTDQLSKRLQDIFNLSEAEEVISGRNSSEQKELIQHMLTSIEYPCWLLDSVLLEGHMYITTRHICFYAYMPKKQVVFLSWIFDIKAHCAIECSSKIRAPPEEREE